MTLAPDRPRRPPAQDPDQRPDGETTDVIHGDRIVRAGVVLDPSGTFPLRKAMETGAAAHQAALDRTRAQRAVRMARQRRRRTVVLTLRAACALLVGAGAGLDLAHAWAPTSVPAQYTLAGAGFAWDAIAYAGACLAWGIATAVSALPRQTEPTGRHQR